MPEVREAQAALAEAYGITGFCYYHYWFSGRRILEMPFNEVLRVRHARTSRSACAGPTSRGPATGTAASRELLIAQRYSAEDDRNHIRWLINGVPRRALHPRRRSSGLLRLQRRRPRRSAPRRPRSGGRSASKAGVGDPYLVQFATFGNTAAPADTGFDAAAEFLPHHVADNLEALGPARHCDDTRNAEQPHLRLRRPGRGPAGRRSCPTWTRYQCVLPNWDNTPRKPQGSANLFLGSTPEKYESWLERRDRQGQRRAPRVRPHQRLERVGRGRLPRAGPAPRPGLPRGDGPGRRRRSDAGST